MNARWIISITLCSFLAGLPRSAAGQSDSHSVLSAQRIADDDEPSAATVVRDTEQKEAAEALVEHLRERLNRPLAELIPAGQVLAARVAAALEFNPAIERLGGLERRLTSWRTQYRKAAELAKGQREGVRAELDRAMAEVESQIGDESSRERELVAVVQLYRPTLLTLKRSEDDKRSRIARIDERLEGVRHRRREYVRRRGALDSRPPAAYASDQLRISDELIALTTVAGDWEQPSRERENTNATESLASALESIEGL